MSRISKDAKIGMLLGLMFIFIIAFIIKGIPKLGTEPEEPGSLNTLTTEYAERESDFNDPQKQTVLIIKGLDDPSKLIEILKPPPDPWQREPLHETQYHVRDPDMIKAIERYLELATERHENIGRMENNQAIYSPDYAAMGMIPLFPEYQFSSSVKEHGMGMNVNRETDKPLWDTGRRVYVFRITYTLPDPNEPNDMVTCDVEIWDKECDPNSVLDNRDKIRDIMKKGLEKRCDFIEQNPCYISLCEECNELLWEIRRPLGRMRETRIQYNENLFEGEFPYTWKIEPGGLTVIWTGWNNIIIKYQGHTFSLDSDGFEEREKKFGARCFVDKLGMSQDIQVLFEALSKASDYFQKEYTSIRERLNTFFQEAGGPESGRESQED